MLIGEYQHTVDAKGRVFVPSKFRDDLGEKFIVTRGIGNCLFGFSGEEWEKISKKLTSMPLTDVSIQNFLRRLFAGATECEVDKQGRILLPQRLREFAKVDKEVVIIGVMSRIEFWAKDYWEEYNESSQEEFESTLSKLAELGI